MTEPICEYCGGLHFGSPRNRCVYICERCGKDIRPDADPRCECPVPASPAERPAHTPQAWEKELFGYIWVTNGQLLCNPEKLAEIVEKIRNEGRDSVLYIRCLKHQGGPQYNKDEHGQECAECAVQAACNNYEALKVSHKALYRALEASREGLQMAYKVPRPWIGGGISEKQWHECCETIDSAKATVDTALANAKALEGLPDAAFPPAKEK